MVSSSGGPQPSGVALSGLAGVGGGLGRGPGVGSTAGSPLPIAEPQAAPRGTWQGCAKRGKRRSTFIGCERFCVYQLVTRR